MKIVLLALAVVFFNQSFAEDLGVFGKMHLITEVSPLEAIYKKAESLVDSGEWENIHEKKKDAIDRFLENPPGRFLPTATEYKKFVWDSSYVVQNDIFTAEGQLIARRGDVINPLDFKNLTKQYCFFNMDDELQVLWIKKNCSNFHKSSAIGVWGDLKRFAESGVKFPIFFDQNSALVDRFGIKKLPSIVRQIGSEIYVEEYPTH